MNCTEFLLKIDAKIDDHSFSDEGFDFHFSSCKSCAASWSEQVSLKERLRKLILAIKPPPDICERVLQAVREKGVGDQDRERCWEESKLGDFLDQDGSSPVRVTQELLREDIRTVMAGLSPLQRDILRLRFGLDDGRTRTLEEVANLVGMTREQVRQIEALALRLLRHPSRSRRPRRERPTE